MIIISKKGTAMTSKKYFFSFSVISLLTIFFCTKITDAKQPKPIKGNTVTNTKAGQILDLSTFTKHSSGIMFKVLKPGKGNKPYAGETVTVDYTGWLLDGDKVGKKFDSSVDRGQNFEFPLGQGYVIKGWDHMVANMKIGEKVLVIIPASLGYGARGAGASIPPHATLLFEIDLYGAQ